MFIILKADFCQRTQVTSAFLQQENIRIKHLKQNDNIFPIIDQIRFESLKRVNVKRRKV